MGNTKNFKRYLVLLCAFFLAMNMANANECLSNWEKTRTMIHDLEDELICSGQDSWKDCFLTLEKKPERPMAAGLKGPVPQCNSNDPAGTYPLGVATGPVQKLALFINTSVIVDDRLQQRVFINSAEEFYVHMQMHRQRVVDLGGEAFKKFPQLFPDLNLEQVKGVLSSHDLAKVNSNVLASNGEPFYRVLFNEGYGKSIDPKWIKELNTRDEAFMEEAYRSYSLNSVQKEQVLKLEKIADLVDRVNNPVSPEEFGRKMFPVGNSLKDKTLQDAVAHLEKRYFEIIRPHDYRPLTKEQYFKLFQELKRKEILSGLRNKGHVELSKRSMKSLLRFESKELISKASALMARKSFIRLLNFANGVGLFFSDMDRVGCDQIGHFDWAKENGNCVPVAGLTPKFIDFVFMNEEDQKKAFKFNRLQCEILMDTHALQKIERLKEKRCRDNGVEFKLDDLPGRISIELEKQSPKKIIYSPPSTDTRMSIQPQIEFNLDALTEDVCFISSQGTQKKCIDSKHKERLDYMSLQMLAGIEPKINANRFYLLKALEECRLGH